MANKRMIDCNFLNAGGFQKLGNKAKLLYYQMIIRSDDKGFVDCTKDIIEKLEQSNYENGETDLTLLKNDYVNALLELINGGFLFEFNDNHGNTIHLIRHWFIHNRLIKGLWTNYLKLWNQVTIVDNEYYMKEKENHLKKEKVKQNNNYHTHSNNEINNNTNDKVVNNFIEDDDDFNKLIEELSEGDEEDE